MTTFSRKALITRQRRSADCWRILVVEDAPELLELIGLVLINAGHVVLGAGTGEQGLRVARREVPDLILLDLELPGIDGIEVLRRLRADETLVRRPIVALTAAAMRGDRERLLAAGFSGYLAKPVRPARLAREVETFLHAVYRGSVSDDSASRAGASCHA